MIWACWALVDERVQGSRPVSKPPLAIWPPVAMVGAQTGSGLGEGVDVEEDVDVEVEVEDKGRC